MTKGSILDMVFIPILLLVIGITIFVAATVLNGISPTFSATSEYAANATTVATTAIGTFNWTFIIIALAFAFGSIIYAFLYPSQPIFFVLGFILLIISMVTTAMMSNVFQTFSASSGVAEATTQFSIINWFMSDPLPIFMAVFGMLMLIVLYTRLQGGRE